MHLESHRLQEESRESDRLLPKRQVARPIAFEMHRWGRWQHNQWQEALEKD